MAKIIIYLGEQERNVLNQLAQREMHDEKTKTQWVEFSLELGSR